MARLDALLASRPGGRAQSRQLKELVGRKFREIDETVDLRRAPGVAPALEVVLSDRGRILMDDIRELCSNIQRSETLAHSLASAERETAPGPRCWPRSPVR